MHKKRWFIAMHEKNARVRILSLFVIIVLGIFLAGTAFAIYAFPGATGSNTILVAQACNTEVSSTISNNFATSCSAVTNLDSNNGVTQAMATASPHNNRYLGARISSFNSSVSSCSVVTNVKLCYEWWSSSASIDSCLIRVDSNGGNSFTTANSTCPGIIANPGEFCLDVTSLESWTCDNFLTSTGTRAIAYAEVRSASGTSKTLTLDSLYFNVTYVSNNLPNLNNISLSTYLIKGGNQMTIYANTTSNGVNDSNADSLTLYCSNTTQTPSVADNICSGTDSTYPYDLTCSYTTKIFNGNETIYCRVYDGVGYSTNSSSANYTIDSSAPSLSVISVAGDSSSAYFDTNGTDGVTSTNVSGESGMSCKWSSSDVSYSSMSSSCIIDGIYAVCNFTDVASQGSFTRYISCVDSLGNENNVTNNLNVDFTLDYTAPTTSDNSGTSIQFPPYIITITESDNVDADPATYYCNDTVGTCTPTTLIDNGGIVTFTSASRGRNYLRYYSLDDAGNTQSTQNKTININRLPSLVSAIDNSTTIKGGWVVNVSTISFDLDSTYSQGITLFVCDTPSATSSGCASVERCTASGTANLSCTFTSELDSATHNWYAYIFDDLGEAATNNPQSGSYITDYTSPTITIVSPANTTYPSVNVTAEISTSEASVWTGYSLDDAANVSMTNISSTSFTANLNNLAYGLHNITFYANDSFGNMGASAIRYFSVATPVDITSPTLTIVSPSNATYTNPSGTYVNISSDEDLVWAGYSLNGGSVENLTNSSARVWYINLTSLSQETNYTLVVYANDSSNNQGNRTFVFYADSLAPRYSSVSAPSTNQSLPVNCSIAWNDTFALTNVLIGENSSGSFENHTITFSGNSGSASYLIIGAKLTTPGSYTCIFYATDLAGNSNSTSTTFSVSDVTAPTITATSPTNGGVYNQVNVTLSLVSNEDLSWAGYSQNGSANVSMGNSSAKNWNYTLTGLVNGQSYSIVFYGNDSSGNVGVSSTIVFSINTGAMDTTLPVLTTTLINASYKNSLPVLFNVSSNENLNWSGYKLNAGSLTNLTNISSILWNGTLSGLVSGSTNTLIIYGNDSANNQGNSTIVFYFDNESAQFSLVNATSVNETQDINCSAYVNDSFGFSSVKISENATVPGVFLNHTIDLSSAGYANYTIYNGIKGSYTCRFYAVDLAGNSMNSTSVNFNVSDVTAPVLIINSPIAQNYSTNSILFSLTTNENISSANYSLNGGVTNVSLTGSGLSWSKVSSVPDGIYTVNFYAIDTSSNFGNSSVNIVVDTTVNDLVAPVVTVWSPLNGSYDLDGSVLLNISSDENLAWAGYTNNSETLNDLGNVSLRNWNATVEFAEGTHTIVFYANDTSTNKNQGNRTIVIYVDKTIPAVNSFNCDSSVNDSSDLTCNASVSDAIGLDYAILSYNFSGSFVNSSQIDLSGTSASLNYTFIEGNYSTPGNYTVQLYLFDLAGRINDSSSDVVHVLDDVAPQISNYTYSPSDSDSLDPGVIMTVNASVTEDYSIGNVYLMFKNETDSNWNFTLMTNTSLIDYNTTFVLPSGNVTIKINATDSYGNVNISYNTTFEVALDISHNITTNISLVKSFIFAERDSANELGYVILNTTSDSNLTYNVTISANNELSRFNLNNTLNQTENYTAENDTVLYIPLFVNLTSLTSGLYPYNITVVSAAGTEVFERNLNVQVATGPYLSISIDTYSSRVTRGETGVEYSATVTNLGTADATGVYLNWTLPSGFSLASGSLTRDLDTLPVGVSGTNTITLDVSSSISESNLTIYATASSTNANSSNASKLVTITNPLTITETIIVTSPSSGGGSGGGGAAGQEVSYSKTIEVVRGNKTSFFIEFGNNRINKTLTNVILNLTGFPEKYMQITPSFFANVYYGESKSFEVLLTAPSYKSYEEHLLKAVIKGNLIGGTSSEMYTETQNIRLIIQEISYNESMEELKLANNSILLMKELGYNTVEMEQLFNQATDKLYINARNKESYDISAKIIQIKETAFEARKLIDTLRSILVDPNNINLLTGNVVKSDVTQNTIFYSTQIAEVLHMADAAFDRSDYITALERAKRAELLLRLDQKGNVLIFLYLYWPQILFALIVFALIGKITYGIYSRNRISAKIKDYNREEENINQLIVENQKNYYGSKIGSAEYHSRANQYHNRLAVLRKSRINLRNKRINTLAPEQFAKELEGEKKEVEGEIIKLQNSFYKTKKVSEDSYRPEFDLLNNRLAEIEDEKIVVDVRDGDVPRLVPKKMNSFFFSLFGKFREKREKKLKAKIDDLLKSKGVKI